MKSISTILLSAFLWAAAHGVASASVVTNCTDADLRAAMAGGGTVSFACDGTITLGSTITVGTDTVLDGNGHQITVSGSNACRVFLVNTNDTFTVMNLTIADGRSDRGAGIFNNGGTMNATGCRFVANQVQGAAGVYTGGDGSPGQDGGGGAVYSTGVLNLIACSFEANSARGGNGGPGGPGNTWTPQRGYTGGFGGAGNGGAVCNFGMLAINDSTFSGNSAVGGSGGTGGPVSGNLETTPVAGGDGGRGGGGNGSALFNGGSASLINSTFVLDSAGGGHGGNGGPGSRPITPEYPSGNRAARTE